MAASTPIEIHVHIHGLVDHTAQLNRMESLMATEAELIAALNQKFNGFVDDVRARLVQLEAERDQLGPDGQAALDALTAAVDAAAAEVGDANGDGTPAPADEPSPEPAA